MMAEVVRLRDLGGGEPNDALTWALFDDSPADDDLGGDAVDGSDDADRDRSEASDGATGPQAHG